MKKRVLSLVMSTAMVASVLTACGSSAEAPATDNNAAATETKTEAAATAATATTEAAATEEVTDYGTGEIKVWVTVYPAY